MFIKVTASIKFNNELKHNYEYFTNEYNMIYEKIYGSNQAHPRVVKLSDNVFREIKLMEEYQVCKQKIKQEIDNHFEPTTEELYSFLTSNPVDGNIPRWIEMIQVITGYGTYYKPSLKVINNSEEIEFEITFMLEIDLRKNEYGRTLEEVENYFNDDTFGKSISGGCTGNYCNFPTRIDSELRKGYFYVFTCSIEEMIPTPLTNLEGIKENNKRLEERKNTKPYSLYNALFKTKNK
jgi:hypothetical protein